MRHHWGGEGVEALRQGLADTSLGSHPKGERPSAGLNETRASLVAVVSDMGVQKGPFVNRDRKRYVKEETMDVARLELGGRGNGSSIPHLQSSSLNSRGAIHY